MSKSGSFTEFNTLLDKATNAMQLEPDIEATKKICSAIDKGVVESSYAIQALYGKMTDENPHTVLFALKVLEKIFYECGNLAHRVICTEGFMSLLKDIIETTEQKLIRNKILELIQTWAVTFKHLPQYSAPEKLLRNLQADGYVFPGFPEQVCEPKKQDFNINLAAMSLNDQNKEVDSSKNQKVLKRNDSNNKDSGIDSDTDMKNREDYFIQSLREIQEKKRRDFKLHQKSLGLPTSSDEEDNVVAPTEQFRQESQFSFEENFSKTSTLVPELRRFKESRQAVERELQKYKNLKQAEFQSKRSDLNNSADNNLQLRSLDEPCSTCELYKKKCTRHDDTFERVIPRLHPDLRKVKESRAVIKNSFEEIKQQKMKEFYGIKSNDWVDSSNKSSKNKDSHEIENENFQKALEISRTDINSLNLRKPTTRLGEMQEQRALEEALRLSLLEPGPRQSSEDEELQRAIDASMTLAEEENFSAFPKLGNSDEDSILLSYITELSLDDSYETEHKLAELYSEYDIIEPCVICRAEKKFLKTFKPCNHKCICDSCSKNYIAQVCPMCRAYYNSIVF